jgi:hypothetical protein
MKRIILLVAFATFSCTSNAKKQNSQKALSTTLLLDEEFHSKIF